jgi:uncharacterized metal-binding protein YceD (DUF177 family)
MTARTEHPELSRPFPVARISEGGEAFHFEAAPDERAALALRFDLVDLPSLEAEGEIFAFDHGRRARVEGIIRARVVQSCVVTLSPVPAIIEDSFVRTYAAAPIRSSAAEQEVVLDLNAEDPPEILEGGVVDVGEAVAETLGLALDPYPRVAGVELADVTDAADPSAPQNVTQTTENKRESPFSMLKGLIKKP